MVLLDTALAGILRIGDLFLGWSLHLPAVVTVLILAVITSVLMALLRRWTTDQDLLARAARDKRRLKTLIREAKTRRDQAAVARHRATNGAIALKLMAAEGKPLLAALLPIAFLGTWAWYRLGYVPPRADEPVVLELSLPPSEVGELAWLVPQDGIAVAGSPVVELVDGEDPVLPHAVARWTLAGKAAAEPHVLTLRTATATYEHPLLVGGTTYTEPVVAHDPGRVLPQSNARLEVPPILGFIPGPTPQSWGGLGALFPSWVITYVLFVLPLFLLGKKVFRLR